MHDLLIRNGTIVDGTGSSRFTGDVAISDGKIAAVGPRLGVDATETIDASGLVVCPGFVDVHSHYDGQAMFDDVLEPSASHGVTTVVLGSCGIGFAPARSADHDRLIEVTEWVEDIPGEALSAGIKWDWESFPGYLDALDARAFAMDVATQVGHVAVRTYVMGDRGVANEEATSSDIKAMGEIVREAIDAGALGFSTSRVLNHKTSDGEPVPGTFAHEDELFGIAAAMADGPRAVFQAAQAGADGDDPDAAIKELDWMRRLSAQFSLPVSFLALQNMGAPTLWKELLDKAWQARSEGAQLTAQVANRPFGMLLGLTTRHPFAKRPTFVELKAHHEDLDSLVEELSKPAIRSQILSEPDSVATDDRFETMGLLVTHLPHMVFPLGEEVDYEPPPEQSMLAIATSRGASPNEAFYDLMLDQNGRCLFLVPYFNYVAGNHDDIYDMLTHPASIPGLGDGGAHVATICDASMPTYQLSHWASGRTRGRQLSLETAVKMHTADTASHFGLGDRGRLEVDKKADINLIDLDKLSLTSPRVVADLPAGASRLVQGSRGYVATIVSGEVTRRDDADTGARPGRLVRGARS